MGGGDNPQQPQGVVHTLTPAVFICLVLWHWKPCRCCLPVFVLSNCAISSNDADAQSPSTTRGAWWAWPRTQRPNRCDHLGNTLWQQRSWIWLTSPTYMPGTGATLGNWFLCSFTNAPVSWYQLFKGHWFQAHSFCQFEGIFCRFWDAMAC